MSTPRKGVGYLIQASNLPSSSEPCPWRFKRSARISFRELYRTCIVIVRN
ncbi:hypothetical protein YC2023_122045 [Brassica napus]